MDFDDAWIKNFETNKQKTNLGQTIKVFYFYIDNENVMQKMNQDVINVHNNVITKDEVIKLIIKNKKKYQLLNILTYIVNHVSNQTDYHEFMKSVKIEDIDISKSIRFFESTNSIFFIFKECSKKLKSNITKKVFITPTRNTRRKVLKANPPEI